MENNFEKKQQEYYKNWICSSLTKNENEYHIINDGILSQNDYTILFENDSKKVYIPVEVTNSLNVFSNVIINSNFLNIMNSKNIIVNFFDNHNRCIGKFIPLNTRKSSLTLLKQVEIYNNKEKRLELAKDILNGGIHNLKTNLNYYNKRYHCNFDEKILKIKENEKRIAKIDTYGQLLLLEARIREIYYSCFNEILKNDEFIFTKRTKRPPKDEINCLISFGNTLLYNVIAKEIYKTNLDIRIAYLHASNNRYESLNLDLADIFKPIIIDKVIFKLINKKMINAKLHFEKKQNGIFLNATGKRIVIREFYRKLRDAIEISGKKLTYETIIRKEIYKLKDCIESNKKFKAFRYY